ncbi:hypothetical protein RvY_10810 [Ramazzottius varieornatus]|uniref:Anaphase-promoting complex subunit 11 n=1 Tax=Ramazzottius varieornatus TaxID=947166 RepID=A0A1D1VE05_RAMVA|nr:hypothetical protein RvY_10810 [Ramazzottius varieornatus]
MNTRQKRLCTYKDQLNKDVQVVTDAPSGPTSAELSAVEDMDVDEEGNEKIRFNDKPDVFHPKTGKRIPKLAVKITEWRAVATWRWKCAEEDDCGICRSPFSACCNDCKFPGEECPIVVGKCSHTFHVHCIQKWLQSQQQQRQTCPMCRQDWKDVSKA